MRERLETPSSEEVPAPRVSVITVFHNRGGMLDESLSSLLAQTHDAFEVIVVDDGSTDRTPEALLAFTDDRIRVITQHNQGFTVSLITAIRAARGEYIAIHGSGDISLPDRLKLQAAVLDAEPSVGVVGCLYDNSESHNEPFRKAGEVLHGSFRQQMMERDPFTHGSLMFRRSHLEAAGGYRSEFEFAQDRDLLLRMSEYCEYRIIPQTLYRRKQPSNAVNRSPYQSLLQTYFVELAIQCARSKDSGSGDLVERFGSSALLLRARSSALARRLLFAGLRARTYGRSEMARIYIQAALSENLPMTLRLMSLIGRSSEEGAIWRHLLAPVMRLVFDTLAKRRSARRQSGQ